MSVTTITSQAFNRVSSGAKRAAENGPVFITPCGEPAHVLLSIAEYRPLSGRKKSIIELLSDPAVAELDFDPDGAEAASSGPLLMYVLGTNVASELRRVGNGRADKSVEAWAARQETKVLVLSAISVLELEHGTCLMERRDPTQGMNLRAWLEGRLLTSFDGRILPVDTAVALRCAALHVPNPRGEHDALIAATGLAHSMNVVTRNTRDFEGKGVTLLIPREAA